MAAGAAVPKPRSGSDQKPCNYQRAIRADRPELESLGDEDLENQPAGEEAEKETQPPSGIGFYRLHDAGENPADAGDLAVEKQDRRRTNADQDAAGQRGEWGKIVHQVSSSEQPCAECHYNSTQGAVI